MNYVRLRQRVKLATAASPIPTSVPSVSSAFVAMPLIKDNMGQSNGQSDNFTIHEKLMFIAKL